MCHMGFPRLVAMVALWIVIVFVAVLLLGLFFGMSAAALLALALSARNRGF